MVSENIFSWSSLSPMIQKLTMQIQKSQINLQYGPEGHAQLPVDIMRMNIGLFNSININQTIAIPDSVKTSVEAIRFLEQFSSKHEFTATSVKIRQPMRSVNLADALGNITLQSVEKFQSMHNIELAAHIIELAHFLQFEQAEYAVALAVVSNFWPSKQDMTDKQDSGCDMVDTILQFQSLIMMSESFQKQQIYNRHLKQFCQTQPEFRLFF